ncbi:MAG: IreB family regulatory phosphoprotein [Erysipelotrichaceae bacterium]|nr:IreB family regulatory phosphoprotein [Erysipelotrichaceae bacterium]
MAEQNTSTRVFSSEEFQQENIRLIMRTVHDALVERGYNPVVQIVGYLVTNDPAYISSYKGARTLIQTVERDDILKELVRAYLEEHE